MLPLFFSYKNSEGQDKMITKNALKEVVKGRQDEKTVVQVLGVHKLQGQEESWRLEISDGINSTTLSLLDPAQNNLIYEGLTKNAIIETNLTCHVIAAKRAFTLRDVRIIMDGSRIMETFGTPRNMDYDPIQNICKSCSQFHK